MEDEFWAWEEVTILDFKYKEKIELTDKLWGTYTLHVKEYVFPLFQIHVQKWVTSDIATKNQ
uniref:Uncharacterized protein n=1 Tax=Megaselia scalaris TaxID=36166 RepID=T1H2P7_MEGSC